MSPPVPTPQALVEALSSSSAVLLTSHTNPDGDAIGSEIALARILLRLGKQVTIWNRDPTPTVYANLPGAEAIFVGEEPPAGFPSAFDQTLLLECPGIERSGHEAFLTGRDLLNVDHHLGNDMYGTVDWVDTEAPSVGEMVLRLADSLKVELDVETATALYLTLVTDTGNFRFSNATPRAFEAAGRLVTLGASPERVSGWLYESQPVGAVRLLGALLRSLELDADGRIATVCLSQEMYREAGASREDSEGLIDYPRSIGGVDVVALIRELPGSESVKVSLRSRGTISVEEVAVRHGGGGHRNAAGCRLDGVDLEAARKLLVPQLTAQLTAGSDPSARSAGGTS